MRWGEIHQALRREAELRADAERLDKLRRRVRHALFLEAEGTVQAREAQAGTHERYTAAEDEYLAAAREWNLAKAEAESLRLRFDAWRTESALEREKIARGIHGEGP